MLLVVEWLNKKEYAGVDQCISASPQEITLRNDSIDARVSSTSLLLKRSKKRLAKLVQVHV